MLSSTTTSELTAATRTHSSTHALGWFLAGIALALCTLELVLRCLPVATSSATGYYFDPLILTYPAHASFRNATGWRLSNSHVLHSNNYGFVADHDFGPDPHAVALIGDSYVEASMLPAADRLAAQIEHRRPGHPVFALGIPGTSLLDYAERVRFAHARFLTTQFVVLLERGDVGEALCGSGNISAPCLDPQTLAPRIEKQPPPGLGKRILRHSALAQFLFSQLKLDPAHWLATSLRRMVAAVSPAPATHAATPRVDPLRISQEAATRVVQTFFTRVHDCNGCRFILVLAPGWQEPARSTLLAAAEQEHVAVVDSQPFLDAYEHRTGLSMRVAPDDGHLNRLALGQIADRVVPLLNAGR